MCVTPSCSHRTFTHNVPHSMHVYGLISVHTTAAAAAALGECQPCLPKHLDSEACRPTAYTEHLTCSTSASHKHEVHCSANNYHASCLTHVTCGL
jgi:hypothetical protein